MNDAVVAFDDNIDTDVHARNANHHPQREPTTRNANPPEDNMEFMSRYSAGLLALMGLHDESGV